MLLNHALRSRSNSSSLTKSLANVRSLARSFLPVGSGFLGMAGRVEGLVMRRALERRQARGNGVVAARLDLHVVRRIGVDQVDRSAVQQSVHILGQPAVAAEEAVLAQDPQVARPGRRRVRRLRARRRGRPGLRSRPTLAAAAARRPRSR